MRVASRLVVLASLSLSVASACGGTPPAPPTAPVKTAPVARAEAPIDVSPVPEPEGLVIVGRIGKPEHLLRIAGVWSHLPLPSGRDLVRSLGDDAVGDVVDLERPIDAAVVVGGGRRDPTPLAAFAVSVRSYDDAKGKLGARHRMTPGANGQLTIEGLGKHGLDDRGEADDDEDDDEACVLAPASEPKGSGRIVCGEHAALEALEPWLTRSAPKQTWASDVHVEVRFAPVRDPLNQLKSTLPILARSVMGGQSPALRELAESVVNEAVDFVGDASKMSIDADVTDAGAKAVVKIDYQRAQSLFARLTTANVDRAAPAPPAFFHLPGEADLAFYGRGSDPKVFEHARDLLGRLALETTEGIQMPEAERKTVRDLVVDRMFSLFTGPIVYGKGFDAAAVDKALAARKAVKPDDRRAAIDAERALAEQVIGWHLVQVSEPIAKVGPILKDWASLWQRPAFVKWMKQSASAKMMAQVRTAPLPAGVTLPKDTVHIEVVVPRHEMELEPALKPPLAPGAKGAAAAKGKTFTPKSIVLHVFAVPDQGATWIGFGLDGKLVAQRAAASLSSASDKDTLGKAGGEVLRDKKANAGWLVTLRGVLVFSALSHRDRTPFASLGTLPNLGKTPIVLSYVAQGPSKDAAAGSAVSTLDLPRATIEDIVRLALAGAR